MTYFNTWPAFSKLELLNKRRRIERKNRQEVYIFISYRFIISEVDIER
jgi:hypothetical protein